MLQLTNKHEQNNRAKVFCFQSEDKQDKVYVVCDLTKENRWFVIVDDEQSNVVEAIIVGESDIDLTTLTGVPAFEHEIAGYNFDFNIAETIAVRVYTNNIKNK